MKTTDARKLASWISLVIVIGGSPAMAETAQNADLSSSDKTMTASQSLFSGQQQAVVTVGGGQKTVQAGDALTAAEYAAVTQVLGGGAQSLQLDAQGRAVGGTFNLSSLANSSLSNLTIPTGVTAIGALSNNAINISGNLVNNGLLLALPTAGTQNFLITSGFLAQGPGASITTTVPTSLASLIAQPQMPINLSIFTQNGINNAGSIAASGILSVASGGSIVNALPQGVTGTAPSMTGMLATIVQSATGSITNSGIIASQLGSVQFAANRDLMINNLNGIIAAAGSCNITQLDPSFKGSTSIIGGQVIGDAINISGGAGVVSALVKELAGPVNVNAGEAHLQVAQGQLNLGNINLTGDPTFVNAGGDIVLNPNAGGLLQFSGTDMAVLASGNVIAGAGLTGIDLSNATGNGGSLTISAGLEVMPGSNGPTSYTLGGASTTGGAIQLSGVQITTYSLNGTGGNVTLVAHDNNNLNDGPQGSVAIGPVGTFSTAGKGGNVLLVAQSGAINAPALATSGTTASGNVEIYSGEVEAPAGMQFINGTLTGGSFKVKADYAHDKVALNVFNYITGAGKVTLNVSGDAAIFGDIDATSDIGITSRQGAVGLGSTITGNKVSASAAGDLYLNTTLIGQSDVSLSSGGNVIDFGSVLASTGGYLKVFANGNNGIAAGSQLISRNDLILAGAGGVSVGNNASLTSFGSTIIVSGGNINIGSGVSATSGRLTPGAAATGLLTYNDIQTFGGTFIIADGTINLNSSLTSNGLDMIVLSRAGDVNLASGTNYTANGGVISMHAGGQINGNANNFYSRAAGKLSDFGGGVIELSSGFSFDPFVLSFGPDAFSNQQQLQQASNQLTAVAVQIDSLAKNPDQGFIAPNRDASGVVINPSLAGNNVAIDSHQMTAGLVLPAALGGGKINISNSQVDMRRGALVITAFGNGHHVNVQNSNFKTESYAVFPTDVKNANLPGLVQKAVTGQTNAETNIFKAVATFDAVNQPTSRLISLGGRLSDHTGRSEASERSSRNLANAMFFVGMQDSSMYSSAGIVDTGAAGYVNMGSVTVESGSLVQSMATAPLGVTGGTADSFPTVRVSDNRSDLMLFTTAGQVLAGDVGGSRHASAIGSQGTAVSNSDSELVLHTGKIYADAGEGPMLVTTKFGKVRLSKGALVAIASEPGKASRVVALAGPADAQIEIIPTGERSAKVTLKVGQQVIIDSNTAADAQTVATRMVVVKERTAISQLLAGEQLVTSHGLLLSGANRQAYDRILAKVTEQARLQGGGFDPTKLAVRSFGFDSVHSPVRVLAAEGSLLRQETGGVLRLKQGSIFTQAGEKQTIITNHGEVELASGGIVTVESGTIRTRVLAFSGPSHTQVKAHGKRFTLLPGEDLLLQTDRPTKADSLPQDGVARRKMTLINLAQGGAVLGDFSIPTALKAKPYLKPILQGRDTQSQSLLARLAKTATVLEMVTGRRGRFYMQPEETASTPQWLYDNQNDNNALAQR